MRTINVRLAQTLVRLVLAQQLPAQDARTA